MVKKCRYCVHSTSQYGRLVCLRGMKTDPDCIPWYCVRDFEREAGSDDDLEMVNQHAGNNHKVFTGNQ